MTITSRAPTRIDFAGGWTDVADFARPEGGRVVHAAVNLFAHVEVWLGGQGIKFVAEDLGERQTFASPSAITYEGPLLLHKAALNMLPVTGGIELISRNDAPLGSGLGGSGALDVALLAALARCRREEYDAQELAELAFELESRELGLLGGRQDQYAAAFGGFNWLTFGENSVTVRPLDVPLELAQDLSRVLVLVYTGQTHFSSQTHARVWEAYQAADGDVTNALRTMRDLADACPSVIEAGDWQRLAALVDENWRQQQRLDVTIATSKTQDIEGAARMAGAWGMKATGAGAGGCMAILADPANRERVITSVRACGGEVLDYEFCFEGVEVAEREDAGSQS